MKHLPGTPAQPAPAEKVTARPAAPRPCPRVEVDTAGVGHLQLLVRPCFKVAFLSKVKVDLSSAYKSYTVAYLLLLLKRRLREHNPCELRCLARILRYKLGYSRLNNG